MWGHKVIHYEGHYSHCEILLESIWGHITHCEGHTESVWQSHSLCKGGQPLRNLHRFIVRAPILLVKGHSESLLGNTKLLWVSNSVIEKATQCQSEISNTHIRPLIVIIRVLRIIMKIKISHCEGIHCESIHTKSLWRSHSHCKDTETLWGHMKSL